LLVNLLKNIIYIFFNNLKNKIKCKGIYKHYLKTVLLCFIKYELANIILMKPMLIFYEWDSFDHVVNDHKPFTALGKL